MKNIKAEKADLSDVKKKIKAEDLDEYELKAIEFLGIDDKIGNQ